MKKHSNSSTQIGSTQLEDALNKLPTKDIPPLLEQRILRHIKTLSPASQRGLFDLFPRVQMAALALGMCGFFVLGASLSWKLTVKPQIHHESQHHFLDVEDPGLLDLWDLDGG